MEADEPVTTLPPESSTLTTGWVLNAAPEAPATGWVVKTSWVAAPVDIAMAVEFPEGELGQQTCSGSILHLDRELEPLLDLAFQIEVAPVKVGGEN